MKIMGRTGPGSDADGGGSGFGTAFFIARIGSMRNRMSLSCWAFACPLATAEYMEKQIMSPIFLIMFRSKKQERWKRLHCPEHRRPGIPLSGDALHGPMHRVHASSEGLRV